MHLIKRFFIVMVFMALLSACAYNGAAVNDTVASVVDQRVDIHSDAFATMYIDPIDGNSAFEIAIAGASVANNTTASIVFSTAANSDYREAVFNADGKQIDLQLMKDLSDFPTHLYYANTAKGFQLTCSELKLIAQSQQVYLTVTFAGSQVSYNLSDSRDVWPGLMVIELAAKHCVG